MPATTASLDFDAERIRRLRIQYGETQQEFGARVGVHKNQVDRWERGLAKPRQARVIKSLLAVEQAVPA